MQELPMAGIVVRKLHMDDLSDVLGLLSEHMFHIKPIDRSAPQRLTKRLHFHYILSVPFSLFGSDTFIGSVAQAGEGNIVGAIIARRFPLGKSWVIGPVVVHKNFRRLDVATHMMNFVMKCLREKKAKSAMLSVERDNVPGRSFFEKFGFKYLEPIFSDHDRARNYARMTTLIHGYLRNPSYKTAQYPLRRGNNMPQTKKTRMWHIMIKELE